MLGFQSLALFEVSRLNYTAFLFNHPFLMLLELDVPFHSKSGQGINRKPTLSFQHGLTLFSS